MDWWIHRVASSQRYSSSLWEICTQWPMTAVLDANMVLDMYDTLDAKAAEKP